MNHVSVVILETRHSSTRHSSTSSTAGMDKEPSTTTLDALRQFVRCMREDTAILDAPSLDFLKTFLIEDLRATIPPPKTRANANDDDDDDEFAFADVDDDERMVPESDAPQKMGPTTGIENASEEDEARARDAKSAASDAFGGGDYARAIEKYTEALCIVPSALTYAKRAECYVRTKRPVSAIRDCDAALALNPDSAKALKIRGAAHRYLGKWNEANRDLSAGLNADFDETYGEIHKKVLSVVHELCLIHI